MSRLTRALLFILFTLLILPTAAISHAQTDPLVYFVGHTASESSRSLWLTNLNGEATRLSPEGANVLEFLASSNGEQVAFVGATSDALFVQVLSPLSGEIIHHYLPANVVFANIELFTDLVWLKTIDTDGLATVMALDPVSGDTVASRTFTRPDITFAFQRGGQWMSAFHSPSGILNIISLPSLENVPVQITGYARSNPIWSPALDSARFAMVMAPLDNQTDLSLFVMDMSDQSTQQIDLPDDSYNRHTGVEWSPTGQYVYYRLFSAPESTTPITIQVGLGFVDLDSGTLSTYEDAPFVQSSVLSWSPDDRFALLFDSERNLNIFDASAGTAFTMDPWLTDFAPTVIEWHPTEDTLAILGQSVEDSSYGVLLFSPEDQAVTDHYSTAGDLQYGTVFWTGDGSTLIFALSAADVDTATLLASQESQANALYALDLASNEVAAITPTEVIVDQSQVQIR